MRIESQAAYQHIIRIIKNMVGADRATDTVTMLETSLRGLLTDEYFLTFAVWDKYEDELKTIFPAYETPVEPLSTCIRSMLRSQDESRTTNYKDSSSIPGPIQKSGQVYHYEKKDLEKGVVALFFVEFSSTEDASLFASMATEIMPQFWALITEHYRREKTGEVSDLLWQLKDAQVHEEDFLNNIQLNKLLENMLTLALRKIGVKCGTILLVNEATGDFEVEPRAVKGKALSILPKKFSADIKSICSYVLKTNHYYICNDAEKDPYYYPIFQDINASLIVPISFQGRTIGVIALESEQKNRFTDEDAEQLLSLSRTATMFIRRAQLYRETSRKGDAVMILGRSEKWKEVEKRVEKASKTDATVVLRGESGTGKELVAYAIHFNSPRKNGPFVTLNCAAIPSELLESEMFGHVKGAFTGATGNKIGEFQKADGGTIFLDEIGDLPLHLQVKLLRTLQSGEIRPVGSSKPSSKVDVRVIAATSRNLEEMCKDGSFRLDIYYRLHVVPIWLPALREYREDIPFIVDNFIKESNGRFSTNVTSIEKEALQALMQYDYPGNVRQLRNFIQQSIIMADTGIIKLSDLPEELHAGNIFSDSEGDPVAFERPAEPPRRTSVGSYRDEKDRVLSEFSRGYFSHLLRQTGGNIQKASKIAGISRVAMYKLLDRYRISYAREKA